MSNCKINQILIFATIGFTFLLHSVNCQQFCPEGWTWYETAYCVKLVEFPVPREYALGMCQLETKESILTSLSSVDELTFLSDLVFLHNQSAQSIWTGGVIKLDGSGFEWQDGSEIPPNSPLWDVGFPADPPSRNRGCIQMTRESGKLRDVSCSGVNNYVLCKILPPWSKLAIVDAGILQQIAKIDEKLAMLEKLLVDNNITPPPPAPQS